MQCPSKDNVYESGNNDSLTRANNCCQNVAAVEEENQTETETGAGDEDIVGKFGFIHFVKTLFNFDPA
jgi:hypothetical protein